MHAPSLAKQLEKIDIVKTSHNLLITKASLARMSITNETMQEPKVMFN